LIQFNKDAAKNFKLMEGPLTKTGSKPIEGSIAHRTDVLKVRRKEFKDFGQGFNERVNGYATRRRVRGLK
jgi:hypothetical protein